MAKYITFKLFSTGKYKEEKSDKPTFGVGQFYSHFNQNDKKENYEGLCVKIENEKKCRKKFKKNLIGEIDKKLKKYKVKRKSLIKAFK